MPFLPQANESMFYTACSYITGQNVANRKCELKTGVPLAKFNLLFRDGSGSDIRYDMDIANPTRSHREKN